MGMRKKKRDQQQKLFYDFATGQLPEVREIELQGLFNEIADDNIRADYHTEQYNLILKRILTTDYQYQAFFMSAVSRIEKALVSIGLLNSENKKLLENVAISPHEGDEYQEITSIPSTENEISVFIDPGDATAEDIADLYVALANYYKVVGGSGLKFTNEGCRSLLEMEAL